MTYAITFDVDWAPEGALEDVLELLGEYGARATFFATHRSEVLHSIGTAKHEVALHPNFNPILNGGGGDFRAVVDALLAEYPESVGARSHSLVQGGYILEYLQQVGMRYDSNLYLPYQPAVRPFVLYNGLLRIPYAWEDDGHFLYGREFRLADVPVSDAAPNIFNFHPVYVLMNTGTREQQDLARQYHHEADKLRKHRNIETLGTHDFLVELLEYLRSNEIRTRLMREIAEEWRGRATVSGPGGGGDSRDG